MVKIVCISDTHSQNLLTKWNIPECDILIHAGDLTSKGGRSSIENAARKMHELPARYVVFVPGNHDRLFYEDPKEALKLLPGVIVLLDETVELLGLRIYGTSWLKFKHGKFPFEIETLKEMFEKIPTNTDILVTHSPPWGIMDLNGKGEHLGSESLVKEIKERIKPTLHVFGHTHRGYGTAKIWDTQFVNASLVDEDHEPTNQPIMVNL
jgi:Icc-related predicted phosphoesterase